ncbi:MAG: phosphotransferase [Bifidobacteriaceae bacterium]|nr:phosphotransferase [Bifidobacteriaceae bacterium]
MNLLALTCRVLAERSANDQPLSQRALARALDVSVGKANQLVRQAAAAGHVDPAGLSLTASGWEHLERFRVDNAIVLAAGFGSRAVPLTYETPKGLLKVHGEAMLERQLRQLREAGIKDLIVVVGYLKEQFEYLIDKFGVKLVFNPEYAVKNNLASLHLVRDQLRSSYVLMADNWMKANPFHAWEPDTWLSGVYFNGPTEEWAVKLGPRGLVKKISIGGADTWALMGPAHFTPEFSARFVPLLEQAYARPGTANWYFEHVIKENLAELPFYLLKQSGDQMREFEDLAELRAFDLSYQDQTNNAVMASIAAALGVTQAQVTDIAPLKNGLTNSSFSFTAAGGRYVYRRPQEAANAWIDRAAEAQAYAALAPLGVTDELVWLDQATGQRITRFWPGARSLEQALAAAGPGPAPAADAVAPVSDQATAREAEPGRPGKPEGPGRPGKPEGSGRPADRAAGPTPAARAWPEELARAIAVLRQTHQSGVVLSARLDPVANLERLAGLADAKRAMLFSDHAEVLALVREAARVLTPEDWAAVPAHGDFTASNVLLTAEGEVKLIDWELAGMGDPLADLASFALAARFAPAEAESLVELYLGRPPSGRERARLYAWSAVIALVNTLWAEYRQALGEQLGEYPLVTYRAAKDYARLGLAH